MCFIHKKSNRMFLLLNPNFFLHFHLFSQDGTLHIRIASLRIRFTVIWNQLWHRLYVDLKEFPQVTPRYTPIRHHTLTIPPLCPLGVTIITWRNPLSTVTSKTTAYAHRLIHQLLLHPLNPTISPHVEDLAITLQQYLPSTRPVQPCTRDGDPYNYGNF